MGEADNGVHRRSYFMAHCGKEVAFCLVSTLGFVIRLLEFLFNGFLAAYVVEYAHVSIGLSFFIEQRNRNNRYGKKAAPFIGEEVFIRRVRLTASDSEVNWTLLSRKEGSIPFLIMDRVVETSAL